MDKQRTDAELVRLACAGDKNAFGQLIERYQQMSRRIALGMVSNEQVAKELAQEAMLQAYLSLDHLRDEARFKSWLYGIVLNVCRSYIREQEIDYFSWEAMMGGVRFEAIHFSGIAPDPQEAAEERELHQLVLKAVNALSPKNRAATLLFYYEQLSLLEIAAILDVSVTAVKGRLHKSRKQLRERLLPLYLEINHLKQRRKTMVKVTIADVVVKKYEKTEDGKQREHHIIVLLDEAGQRALPIWVGPFEGQTIAMGLRGLSTPRPMTFNFMASLLEAVDVELEEVRVEALKDETFYGVARLRNGDRVQEVDARPSDAIALAVRTGSPIYVADEVMKMAGVDVSREMAQGPKLGQGLDGIIKEIEEKMAVETKRREEKLKEEVREGKTRQAQREVIALVFGGER
jgi:RNA polymerase sigma factor (sigma-70 family)